MNHRWIKREGQRWSLFIYEHHHQNYTAQCQVILDGGIGNVDSVQGAGFYRYVRARGLSLWAERGITKIRAAVSIGHAELMASAVDGWADVIRLGENTDFDGLQLINIEVVPL